MSAIRVCRTCGLEAYTADELKLFCGDKANKTGYSTICLECNKIRTNKYKKDNYEKVIKAKRRHLVEKR